MKRIFLVLFMLVIACRLPAQRKAMVDSIPKNIPQYYIWTDLVYDIESIPTVGYEKFFVRNNRLKSWRIVASYQVHYSNQFGIVLSHGDKISVGVYQGPVAKFGYSLYGRRPGKYWKNYFSPDLGIKYLWYNDEQVNTGKHRTDLSYRIQSEQCIAIVPQFTIGAKHVFNNFCADFYCGLQFPIKIREKTIYEQYNSMGVPFGNVPYNTNQTTLAVAPVFGIKLGYIK
jgi:hypothetical protein